MCIGIVKSCPHKRSVRNCLVASQCWCCDYEIRRGLPKKQHKISRGCLKKREPKNRKHIACAAKTKNIPEALRFFFHMVWKTCCWAACRFRIPSHVDAVCTLLLQLPLSRHVHKYVLQVVVQLHPSSRVLKCSRCSSQVCSCESLCCWWCTSKHVGVEWVL